LTGKWTGAVEWTMERMSEFSGLEWSTGLPEWTTGLHPHIYLPIYLPYVYCTITKKHMSKKPANSNNDYNKNNNKTSFTPEKKPQKQTKA